jgi:hypothetical protein
MATKRSTSVAAAAPAEAPATLPAVVTPDGFHAPSVYANPGLAVPHLDWNDPDD